MEGGLELELPEPIIQRIQSFLTGKEAARTTILSKAWHNAWLTLPYLVFDEGDFTGDSFFFSSNSEFLKYVKNKIGWYEQSNLKIDSLKLCMHACDDASLIVKSLLKLGATRLSFKLIGYDHVVFPHDVLFGDNNLVELSLHGYCNYGINIDETTEINNCRLQSLSLNEVQANTTSDNDDMPVGLMNTNLDRLRSLKLCYGSFKSLFPGDLLSKFPVLTDFTLLMELYLLDSFAKVQISNRSLERVKLLLWGRDEIGGDVCRVSVNLDVPNVRLFTFEIGDAVIPTLSVVSCSTTNEWESHVSIKHYSGFTASWFGELDKLLAELRQSKIHLSLLVESQRGFDYKVGDVESVVVRKHELENLTIDMTGMPSCLCYALFDGLFRFCRPKIITLDKEKEKEYEFFYGDQDPGQRKMMFDMLCELIDQGIRLRVSDPRLFVYGSLCDLEEANAQVFDDDDDEHKGWRPPIPLKSLLDDQGQHQRLRLLLKWKTTIDS